MQKNILVIGENGHGKSEFGKALTKELNSSVEDIVCRRYDEFTVTHPGKAVATHYSTSDFIIHRLSQKIDVPVKTIRDNKESYRQQLIDYGNIMCDADPGILVSTCQFACATDFCIIDGVRRKNEYDAVRKTFDKVFYILRPDHKSVPDNFELYDLQRSGDVCTIVNDSDINVLLETASVIAQEMSK